MSLLRCGEAQKQLGEAEKKFVQSADIHFLTPLRSFSDGQYKGLQVPPPRYFLGLQQEHIGFFFFSFCSSTGRAQDVVEQAFGPGHRSFQSEKSPRGRAGGQSERFHPLGAHLNGHIQGTTQLNPFRILISIYFSSLPGNQD